MKWNASSVIIIDKNTSKFRWSQKHLEILNELIGKKSNISQIDEVKVSETHRVRDATGIANHLNQHFTQIGPNLASTVPSVSVDPKEYLKNKVNSSFVIKEIAPSKVKKLLEKVDISKATGLDNISNRILRIAALVIYQHLTDLFNLSIKRRVFPTDWKKAKVSPIYKSGERNDPNNYRPISFLPAIARIFGLRSVLQVHRRWKPPKSTTIGI